MIIKATSRNNKSSFAQRSDKSPFLALKPRLREVHLWRTRGLFYPRSAGYLAPVFNPQNWFYLAVVFGAGTGGTGAGAVAGCGT